MTKNMRPKGAVNLAVVSSVLLPVVVTPPPAWSKFQAAYFGE
jgi:hypothetical protein